MQEVTEVMQEVTAWGIHLELALASLCDSLAHGSGAA